MKTASRRALMSSLGRAALTLSAAAIVASGCGWKAEAISAPALASASTAASSPASAPAWLLVSTTGAKLVRRSARRLALPHRQIVRTGMWHVDDATDRVAVLRKLMRPHDELWLLDADQATTHRIFTRAVTPVQGWWIAGVKVSDTWIAWEELAPGDDLVQSVEWRLFAAPLDLAAHTVGEPRLVASAVNTERSRPLFDVSGDRLVWLDTTWRDAATVAESRLLAVRLGGTDQPHELYRSSQGMLTRVSTRGDKALISEVPAKGSRRIRVQVLNLETGDSQAKYDLPSPYGFSHWPVWQAGRLAWTTFPRPTSSVPALYLRTRSGRVYRPEGLAADPVFVGPYLFYEAGFSSDAIRGIRLRDMKSFILAGGRDAPADISWSAIWSAPDLRRTYYAYRIHRSETALEDRTLIRIYQVE